MNVIEATRAWLRSSDLIDKENRFNAGYLGIAATEYSLATTAETHKEDVLGADHCTYSLAFYARLPYGAAMKENISAADFFSNLSAWIRKQKRSRNFPVVDGYVVTDLAVSNAGIIVQADANTARYQLQLKISLKEIM